MLLKPTLLLTSFLVFISCSLFAQESKKETKIDSTIPIITWNSKLKSFDKELPFDQSFYIRIPKKKEQKLIDFTIKGSKKPQKGESPHSFTRLEGRRMQKVYELKSQYKIKDLKDRKLVFLSNDRNKKSGEDSVFVKIEDKNISTSDTEIYVKIFPLNPNAFYGFSYTLELDGKILSGDIDSEYKTPNSRDTLFVIAKNLTASFYSLTASVETPLNETQTRIEENKNLNKRVEYEARFDAAAFFESSKYPDQFDTTGYKRTLQAKYDLLLVEDQNSESVKPPVSLDTLNKSDNPNENTAYNKIRNFIKRGERAQAIDYLVTYDSLRDISRVDDKKNNFSYRINTLKQLNKSIDTINFALKEFLNGYDSLIKFLINCESCDNQNVNENLISSNIQPYLIPHSLRMGSDSTKARGYIVQGRLAMNYQSIDSLVQIKEIDKRRKNVVTTINFLEKITKLNWYDTTSSYTSLRTMDNFKSKKIKYDSLLLVEKQLSKDLISYELRTDKGIRKPLANYIVEESGGTTGSDLTTKSKSKFTVRPDIGVGLASNIIDADETSNSFFKLFPFFGVRFNLRPINPDLPLKQVLYKNFLHRSSINISYSPTSVSNNSTRFDLFGSNNLLVGYGYRINNAFNLSAGALLFRRKTTESPFVSNKELAAMPYVALTLDFDIVNTLKSLANAFGAKIP